MGVNEHALAIKLDGYWFVTIVGCLHPGSTISLRDFIIYLDEVYLVIGGFHDPSQHRLGIAARYSGYVCSAHCSGREARRYVVSKYLINTVMLR